MAQKRAIIEALGERHLLVPQLLDEALSANTRIKYVLSLLQLARAHADEPELEVPRLRSDRLACGIDDPRLDGVPEASHTSSSGGYEIPHVRELVMRLHEDVGRMLLPLHAVAPDDPRAAEALSRRLEGLHLREATAEAGVIRAAAMGALTATDRSGPDSVHLLVMDAHRALNALIARAATETIEGAQVFAIADSDRALVAAFMRGVNETARLKFSHPGLTTTATRARGHLVLQNDIGATEAHVILVNVAGLTAQLVTTDVHLRRIEFLRTLLRECSIRWEETHLRRADRLGEEPFYVCVGTLEAADAAALERFLTVLGSRLVFLIDWNRARKQLRQFVPGATAIELLERAAAEHHGHRGFLELGGEELIHDALTAVLRAPFRFGESLDEVVGVSEASRFLAFVLRVAAQGLLEGRSRALLRELVRLELADCVGRSGERLLGPVRRHATLVRELAGAVRECLATSGSEAAAGRAKERERAADEIVVEMRSLADRLPNAARYCQIVEAADDAADAFEEAAFQLTISLEQPAPALFGELQRLGELTVEASEAYARGVALAHAGQVRGATAEARAFLEAIDRVLEIEHQTDLEERRIVAAMLGEGSIGPRGLFVVTQVVAHLEEAADALMHASLLMRTAVLGTVMAEQRKVG